MAEEKFLEQKKTLDDARRLLGKYGKCMVIRPTGFGKTWLLTELIHDYDKVLYLYPSAVVRDTVVNRYAQLHPEDLVPEDGGSAEAETLETYRTVGQMAGCTLMTYSMLTKLRDDDFEAMDYGLVIFDEAHRMGGTMTKAACERLFAELPETAHFIGATATPTRMDNFDPCSHFFSDRMCYAYTLHDAISAGMIAKPRYCYATYDFRRDLEDTAKESGQDLKDPYVADMVSAKAIELAELFNMPKILQETCGRYAPDAAYMKFIVFFASLKHMSEKMPDVKGWFSEAFPGKNIRELRISSASRDEASNTDKLDLLEKTEGTIDLIGCVDMLNMGYHVSDLTGIVMYRGTKSGTIFTQQLGRALSAGADSPAIVFDIVDNLHRRAVYELYAKPLPGARKHRTAKPALDNYELDEATGRIMFVRPDGSLMATQYHVDKSTGKIVDRRGHATSLKIDRNGEVSNTSDPWSETKDINRVDASCLEATGHEATYREILAKAMAEPLSHRCKYALQLHFRSWCLSHGVDYPISDRELSEIYGLDIQDFYQEFRRVIQEKKIAYPLQDAESLMAVGSDGSTDAPLAICCEATGVSVQALLDMIFA